MSGELPLADYQYEQRLKTNKQNSIYQEKHAIELYLHFIEAIQSIKPQGRTTYFSWTSLDVVQETV